MTMTADPARSTPPRYAAIDVLRALLACAVVLLHLQIRVHFEASPIGALLPNWLIRILCYSGYYAVMIFFVLSGFLITELSLRRWGSLAQIHPWQFYRLRFARIAPCLLLLLVVISALHLMGLPDYRIHAERASLGRALLAALTFHVNWLEGRHGYLPANWDVLWSLSVEEIFYLAFPLVCVLVRSRAQLLLLASTLIVLGPLSRTWIDREPWDEYAWLCCFDGIAIGCVAAAVARAWQPSVRAARRSLMSLMWMGGGLAVLVLGFRHTTSALGLAKTGLNVTVLELGSALMLIAVYHGAARLRAVRGLWLLRWIGKSSYEIYLTHMFVVLSLVRLYRTLHLSPSWIPVLYGVALVLSGALGVCVARWYSEPMNRRLRSGVGQSYPPRETRVELRVDGA